MEVFIYYNNWRPDAQNSHKSRPLQPWLCPEVHPDGWFCCLAIWSIAYYAFIIYVYVGDWPPPPTMETQGDSFPPSRSKALVCDAAGRGSYYTGF